MIIVQYNFICSQLTDTKYKKYTLEGIVYFNSGVTKCNFSKVNVKSTLNPPKNACF